MSAQENKQPEIKLKIDVRKFNQKFYKHYYDSKTYQIYWGGGGSGKSYWIAKMIMLKVLTEPGHKFLVVRKVKNTIRDSVFKQFKKAIEGETPDENLSSFFKIPSERSNNLTIKCTNKSEIIFTGLDDVEKIKSITGITEMWIEEATEITQADFNQLNIRIRGKNEHKKKIYISFNPVNKNNWVYKTFFENDKLAEKANIIHSTYKDNKFLTQEDIDALELYKYTNQNFYNVYCLGQWGSYKDLVFSDNVKLANIAEEYKYDLSDYDYIFNGMDYGTRDPNVLVRAGFKKSKDPKKPDQLFVFYEYYKQGIQNKSFIRDIKEEMEGTDFIDPNPKLSFLKKQIIKADSAAPAYIAEWRDYGFKVFGAEKGNGSIKKGIDFLRSIEIIVDESCPKTYEELTSYSFASDIDDVKNAEKFQEGNDHCIDCLRYGSEPYWRKIRRGSKNKIKIVSI